MSELLGGWKRTNYCANFTKADAGKDVILMGWANVRRDLGALVFVQLRDRTGLMQIVFNSTTLSKEDFERACTIRSEYVLAVRGELVLRTGETVAVLDRLCRTYGITEIVSTARPEGDWVQRRDLRVRCVHWIPPARSPIRDRRSLYRSRNVRPAGAGMSRPSVQPAPSGSLWIMRPRPPIAFNALTPMRDASA